MSIRGFGKSFSRKSGQTGIQLDQLFHENSNRPSAVRSAGVVGKWGITSFTSIRTPNGFTSVPTKRNDKKPVTIPSPVSDNVKPKKFFKSRNPENVPVTQVKSHEPQKNGPTKAKTVSPRAKKQKTHDTRAEQNESYLANRNETQRVTRSSDVPDLSPSDNATKPPIVIRISKGKSRLLSDSDESDTNTRTPETPTLTRLKLSVKTKLQNSTKAPKTAKKQLRKKAIASPDLVKSPTSSIKSPNSNSSRSPPQHSRVTRSTRRNQVSEDECEQPPVPTLFSPPRKNTKELHYIPAEEYELERKAIYANLLGGMSPTYTSYYDMNKDNELPNERDKAQQAIEPTRDTIETTTTENVQATTENTTETAENTTDTAENDISMDSKAPSPVPVECSDLESVLTAPDQTSAPQPHSIASLIADTHPAPASNDFDTNESVTDDHLDILEVKLAALERGVPVSNLEHHDVTSGATKPCNVHARKNFNIEDILTDINENASGSLSSDVNEMDVIDAPVALETNENVAEESVKEVATPLKSPPVKLVISKKKGSIFKSRALLDGAKKRHLLYKHKWSDDKDNPQKPTTETNSIDGKSTDATVYDATDFETNAQLTRVTQETMDFDDESEAITSVKCNKKATGFYTVVRNVKKAHQIQEIGEFQEFNDDVDYILDALQDNNPNSTRCLSAITLATKCMTPAFRMHVRAHGTVGKFFKALHDATKDQSLGLCTATVMFVLSQDRLNMDLDRDCLELMLNLLESDVSHKDALADCGLSSAQLQKNKQKVTEICAEIKSQGHAQHLNLENITVGQLAMETLLSLTSKRAGEWFKEELRELGGLEHIIKTICECCRQVSDYVVTWTDTLLDKLRKVERCMRVLENVTQVNEENQTYILNYSNGAVVETLVKLYRLCDSEMPLYPVTDISDKESPGAVIREALLVTLKVLINLTHHFNVDSNGGALIGAQDGIIEASLHLLLQVPNYIPDEKKFELSILVLMLLINLIQHCAANKKMLIEAKAPSEFENFTPCDKSAVEALIEQFYVREQQARVAEQRTDAILDGDEKDTQESEASATDANTTSKSREQFIEETVDKLLQKAGTHMEHTMAASHIVMLIGFLIMDSDEYEARVRNFIADHKFTAMRELLIKFFNFMNLTASGEAVSVCHIKATERVIKYLEQCDAKETESADDVFHMSLSTPDKSTSPQSSPMTLERSNTSMNDSLNMSHLDGIA